MKTDASSNVREGCFDVRAGKIKEMQYHNTLSLGDTQQSDFLGSLISAFDSSTSSSHIIGALCWWYVRLYLNLGWEQGAA